MFLTSALCTPLVHGASPVQARHVVLPVYGAPAPEAVALLKADKVFTESRRAGFFRVRALPLLVAQGVQLELRTNAPLHALTNLAFALRPLAGGGATEWRSFQLQVQGDTKPRLEARTVRPLTGAGSGAWIMDEAILHDRARDLRLSRAQLRLAATPAVYWETRDTAITWNLLTGSLHTNRLEPSAPKKT